MTFEREIDAAAAVLELLHDPVQALGRSDAQLAEYLRRSGARLCIALGEARWREGSERTELIQLAVDSAAALRSGVELAARWCLLDPALGDRVVGLLGRELGHLVELSLADLPSA
jgi:hypothetical protein